MVRFWLMFLAMFITIPMNVKEIETQRVEKEQKVESSVFADAKCFADVEQYMTITSEFLKYSDCDDEGAFDAYFDLLMYSTDSYFTFVENGESYLAFMFVYDDYGTVLKKINDIKQVEDDGTLQLSISMETKKRGGEIGCEPDISYCRCILKLDRGFEKLMVEGREYEPYDGGMIYVNDQVGILDEYLNVIVPIQFDRIWRYPIYEYDHSGTDSLRVYYKAFTGNATALLDEQYRFVLQPEYRTVYYVSDNCFLVTTPVNSSAGLADSVMKLIDAKGNVLSEEMPGWISDSYTSFTQTYARQLQFAVTEGKDVYHGVLDENLNIVIEPIYKKITTRCSDTEEQYYMVENQAGRVAVFDIYGKQLTDFEKQ